jgi:hypothetical protein
MNFNLTGDRTHATKSIRDALGGSTAASKEEGAAALLSKSENFAVSLRKTKRKQILNDKRGRFMMGQQRSRQQQHQRELDNSPIAIATREFVGAVTGKAPYEVVSGCLSILS